MSKPAPNYLSSGLKISDCSKTVRNWISQFEIEDREAARHILLHLDYVSAEDFSDYIKEQIQQLAEDSVVAFYAVKEVENGKPESVFKRVNESISPPGSEVIVQQIISRFCNSRNGKKCMDHPDIEKLRVNKCRKIVLIDDIIGSGNRISEYLDAFRSIPTIRSWLSGKLIEFYVVSYTGTKIGIKKLCNNEILTNYRYKEACLTYNESFFPDVYKEKIFEVFKKYGEKTYKPEDSLGYNAIASFVIFSHGCPNNTPGILWRKGKTWKPLFPKRFVDQNFKRIYSYSILKRNRFLLRLMGEERISKILSRLNANKEKVIMILLLISRGKKKRSILSSVIGLDDAETLDLLDKCIESGLITKNLAITEEGKNELNIARKSGESIHLKLPFRGNEYYYPSQLR